MQRDRLPARPDAAIAGPLDPDTPRHCPRCDQDKTLAVWSWRDKKHTSPGSWCAQCQRDYNRLWMQAHAGDDEWRARMREAKRRRLERLRLRRKLDRRREAGIPPDPQTQAEERHIIYRTRKESKRRRWNRECLRWRKKNRERRKEHERRHQERKKAGLVERDRQARQDKAHPPPMTARLHYAPATASQPPAVLVWPAGARQPIFRCAGEDEARTWAAEQGYTLLPDSTDLPHS